ncbi:MAG TPA: sigma-54-dependent Fis family transcriptional regulator, partial [Myxococcales bacterium]|nr:sigma-54-dependent Fis family transcriptional regulator [Myxococcales bacterium]
CDIRMPTMSGTDFLKQLAARKLTPSVIMMSAYGSLDTAIECMKLGAEDYISKPFKPDELLLKLHKVMERDGLRNENERLRQRLRQGVGTIIGKSELMLRLFETIERIAQYKSTVLISGESGTGKELVARAVHDHSKRANNAFIAVNCGAIPEHLLESELFGHVKGAFTDAIRDKKGMFEEADSGTLFLDEIGELPLNLQVKLLRVIQEEEIRRVGDSKLIKIDVRLVAATIRDLKADVEEKRFREDLFYRLNVLPISLPPLRDRQGDIPLLVDAFVEKTAKRLGKKVTSVSPEAIKLLARYSWPGNVRELENTIERACVFADDEVIIPEVLPEHIAESSSRVRLSLASGELSIKRTTRIIEEELIRRALTQTGGNRTAASKLLEISHRALLYKIKEYNVDIPPR